MNNNLFLEKINYREILAHKDWDGLIGGGLIQRIFDLPIIFLNRVNEATAKIIIEVPFALDAYIEKCLIIDHHDCKRAPLKSLHFGNHVLCDEEYGSVASMIVDFFDLDAPDEILDALDHIERGDIDSNELAYRMFISFASSIGSFPYEDLVKEVRVGRWERIINWVNKKASSKEAELVKGLSERKLNNVIEIMRNVKLITYNTQDPLDIGAARLALLTLEKQAKIGVMLGLDDIYARFGIIATMKKKINLIPLLDELSKLSWQSGGRSNVGGFQITYNITLNQAINALREAILKRKREINL